MGKSVSVGEARLRSVLDSLAVAVYGIDTDGNCTFANPACVEILGYSDAGDLLSKHMHELIHHTKEDGSPYPVEECLIYRAPRQGSPTHVDNEVLWRADGTCFPAEYWSRPVIHDGVVTCSVVTFVDITERRRAQDALAQSERHFRTLADSAPYAVALVGSDGRLLLVNRVMEEILGYSSNELLGQPVEVLLPERHRLGHVGQREEMSAALRGRRMVTDKELVARHKDGHEIAVEIGLATVATATGPQTLIALIDITDRKQAERERERLHHELRQAHKMEAVGLLAGGIAHDFNNILGAIIGSAELAMGKAPADSGLQANLQRILDGGSRARDLVGEILAFSRNGRVRREPVDLSKTVHEALGLIRASLPAMIEIRESLTALPAMVRADATQLHQVVMNLCANAGYAMKESGGTLEVHVSPVDVDAGLAGQVPGLREGSYVKLTVRDSGCGMDTVTCARVFDPFFTTKPIDEGTGMGLAVVHGIVGDHGGAIRVRSAPGGGTTFDVYLPRSSAAPKPTGEKAARVSGTGSILLVDDDAALAATAAEMLEELGYRVTTLDSSIEAMKLFSKKPRSFDVVVTDQAMPRLSGLALATLIKSVRPDIPVIVTTGYSDAISAENVRAKGFHGYVAKPYTSVELGKAVRDALTTAATGHDVGSEA